MKPIEYTSPVLFTDNWIGDSDKARAFALIFQGKATSRLDLIKLLSIRSTTISEIVADLLNMRFLTETTNESTGRGRPKQLLVVNPNRLVSLVFYVISQSLHAAAINLAGQVLIHEQIDAPFDSNNQQLTERFRILFQTILSKIPDTLEIAGIAFSLPGLIDVSHSNWIFAARWPQMHHLHVKEIFPDYHTSLSHAMNSELRARLSKETQSTLFLHWGFGIGTAFGVSPDRLGFGGNGFGEIGHWRIKGQNGQCHCGRQGCLETVAAYWSLGPELLKDQFSTEATEDDVAIQFQSLDLLSFPAIPIALEHVVTSLANLCRIFFPNQVIVSGPFVANPQLWSEFCKHFYLENHFIDLPQPTLIAARRSREYEVYGAANPILEQTLHALLK